MPPNAAEPDLPIHGHTIASFLALLALLLSESRTAEFVILMLTGRYDGKQASVEALHNRIYNEGDDDEDGILYPYKTSRDIDSAIGISDDICVINQHIVFYVVPSFAHTLTSSVGLSRRVVSNGIGTMVKLHKIPNYLFARWGIRNEILIFFPGRYKEGERNGFKVDNADIAAFFENVTRPALLALVPDLRAANLPPTYDAELWRSRGETGTIVKTGRVLSEDVVSDLGGELRDKLDDAIQDGIPLEWARDFFFVHQVRGVKDANTHARVDAEAAFDHFITTNNLSRVAIETEPDNWFFDIGLEVSSESGTDSLVWRADSHTPLLRDVFRIPEAHAVRMTKIGSSSYYKDSVSHLTEVAGCRVTPGVRGRGPLQIAKLQAYHTDKAVTASMGEGGGHHAKHVSLNQLLNDKHGGFIDKLFQVCEESKEARVVANARLEVRVPYSSHARVYDTEQVINWRKYLLAIPCDHWWSLRTLPLIAYKTVASSQTNSPPADRTNINAIALLIIIVWLTNSLHATPDTGPSSRRLLEAVLPRRPRAGMPETMMPYRLPRGRQSGRDDIEDEWEEDRDREVQLAVVRRAGGRQFPGREEDEESDEGSDEDEDVEVPTSPCNPFGIVFLNSVVWDNQHRVPMIGGHTVRVLKEDVFEYFAGMAFDDFVNLVYDGLMFEKRSKARTRNKVQQRPVILEEGESIPTIFSLRNGTRTIPRPVWQGGRIDRGEREELEVVSRNDFLSEIFNQLCVDAISTSPSPHGNAPAYTKIDRSHFPKVTFDLFKDNNPGKAFYKARMAWGSDQDWETAFKHILPPKSALKTDAAQNYPKCAYYKMWGHLMASIPSNTAIEEAREAFKEKFLAEVVWFPWAKSERLWESNTKPYKNRQTTCSPKLGRTTPAPWLLLRRHCVWKEDEKWVPNGTEVVPAGLNSDDDDD